MPSGKVAKPDITDNKDGTVTVRYAPTEAGLHEMDIRYDNMHIPGTFFTFARNGDFRVPKMIVGSGMFVHMMRVI